MAQMVRALSARPYGPKDRVLDYISSSTVKGMDNQSALGFGWLSYRYRAR